MSNLLVCVDLTERTEVVLAAADALAAGTGDTLHVLHVSPGEPAFMGFDPPGGIHDPEDHAVDVEHDRTRLEALVQQAGLRSPAERLVVAGPTVEAIFEIAGGIGASMIVAGRGSHGRLAERLLGSVATELVRRSPIPVLVVPVDE